MVRSKGRPKKCWLVQVNSLKKEFNLQDKVLDVQLFKKALDKREREEYEIALKHKSTFRIHRWLGLRNS